LVGHSSQPIKRSFGRWETQGATPSAQIE
jgi:hypothetical protein